MKTLSSGSYNEYNASQFVNLNEVCISLSTEFRKTFKYVDGKRTDEISGYKAWFVQEGTDPFEVKFASEPKLPKFGSEVKLLNLEACIFNNNVYFRASGLKL